MFGMDGIELYDSCSQLLPRDIINTHSGPDSCDQGQALLAVAVLDGIHQTLKET